MTGDAMRDVVMNALWITRGRLRSTQAAEVLAAITAALERPLEPGKPSCIIARTTKGKGVSFMEDVGKWHHGVPNDDEFARANAELDAAIVQLSGGAA